MGRACLLLGLGPAHELSVLLCDAPTIRRLNARWRGIDKPTDVLSFPLQELAAGDAPGTGPLGDIVIAMSVARRGALELNVRFEDHMKLLLVHGLLHLLGHDHHKKAEAERMEKQEKWLLAQIS